ncbi:DNA helicase MCM9-like [Centruroides sculpturatus]|uniref:DNA helicase MCM9-like n=1 Tax=Centruroides sculpturatus TaxID=218467 RepID=UPI000C6D2F56|nr:DNA helicase MCM9-like [Centruroides sculpturatus]
MDKFNLIRENLIDIVKCFAKENYRKDLEAILMMPDIIHHYAVVVCAKKMFDINTEIAHSLLTNADEMLKLIKNSFKQAAIEIYNTHSNKEKMCLKPNIHVRLSEFPACAEIYRSILPKCADIGKFVIITVRLTKSILTE